MTSPAHREESEKSGEEKVSDLVEPDLKGDWSNIFLLLLLYTMQGMPLGLAMALPIILQSKKNVTYQDQAFFSLVGWPYSLKLIWAPIVDAFYVQKIGRRKSWLVPIQLLMGVTFLYMASDIDHMLPEEGKPNILKLVVILFFAKLLAATQDIVVDGWTLTMLKRNNVGYASTCGSMGLVIGMMIGSVFSVLLTSENFCNKYLRFTPGTGGITTMKSIFFVWGILFILVTTLIAIFKKEKDNRLEDNHVKLNIYQNYLLLWDILKLPVIQILGISLLTAKIGFAATDSVSMLKLIDAGVSKDVIIIINTVMYAVKMIIPLIVAKHTSGPKPMNIYLIATPIRLLWNFTFVLLIYYTPRLIQVNGVVDFPIYYYAILALILSVYDILLNIMHVAITAFFSRISDPRFGGTYMTLLNTLANLGNAWTSSVAIGMVDLLTFKQCSFDSKNNCSTMDLQNTCKKNGGDCIVWVSGYYVETAVCTVIGIFWFYYYRNILKNLQTQSLSQWLVDVKKTAVKENDDKNAYSMTVQT